MECHVHYPENQCMRSLFQFVTSVVSCCPAELKQEVNGKKETLKGFNIKLQDTILFPEGGGQVRRPTSLIAGVYLTLQ